MIPVRVREDVSIAAPLTHFMRATLGVDGRRRVGAAHRPAGIRVAHLDGSRDGAPRRAARSATHSRRGNGPRAAAGRSGLANPRRVTDPRLGAIEASLRRRFRVVETEIQIEGRAVSLLHPASAEELIDEQAFERDERLPYWAELWPSSRIMAQHVFDCRARAERSSSSDAGQGWSPPVPRSPASTSWRRTTTRTRYASPA